MRGVVVIIGHVGEEPWWRICLLMAMVATFSSSSLELSMVESHAFPM
jgi:hypothetical protein